MNGIFNKAFEKLRQAFNDPKSSDWLPLQLTEMQNPDGQGKLLPLRESDWTLQLEGSAGKTFRESIVDGWWQNEVGPNHKGDPNLKNHQSIAFPARPWPQLMLPKLTIDGLANVWIADHLETIQTSPTSFDLQLVLQFGFYRGQQVEGHTLPNAVLLTGTYTISQELCSAAAGTPPPAQCDGWDPQNPPARVVGDGEFAMEAQQMTVRAKVTLDVPARNELTVQIRQLSLTGPEGQGRPTLGVTRLTVDTDLHAVSELVWIPQAKKALSSPQGAEAIFSNMERTLNQHDALEQVSRILEQRMVAYLEAHHLYPFNSAFEVLF
ncbi:MAG: hypothetical protein AAGC60_19595 [Acidobacteriota bacterium]